MCVGYVWCMGKLGVSLCLMSVCLSVFKLSVLLYVQLCNLFINVFNIYICSNVDPYVISWNLLRNS